jgi:hypothetical protein
MALNRPNSLVHQENPGYKTTINLSAKTESPNHIQKSSGTSKRFAVIARGGVVDPRKARTVNQSFDGIDTTYVPAILYFDTYDLQGRRKESRVSK